MDFVAMQKIMRYRFLIVGIAFFAFLLMFTMVSSEEAEAVDIWWTGAPQPFCDGCVWDPAMDTNWRIQDDLYVPAGQIATIQPGTVFQFDSQGGIFSPEFVVGQNGVGNALLDATGGAMFTIYTPTTMQGDWGGIYVTEGSDFFGDGVVIEDVGLSTTRGWAVQPGIVVNEGGSLYLSNSVIQNVVSTGIEIDGTLGSGDLYLDNVEVSNPNLWSIGNGGIYIHDWTGGGAYYTLDSVKVHDTDPMVGNPFPGIALNNVDTLNIINTEIWGTTDEGLVIWGGSTNINIIGGTYRDAATDGIRVIGSSGVTIHDIHSFDNGRYGVFFDGGTTNSVLNGSVVNGTASYPVYDDGGTGNTITNNTLRDSSATRAIYLNGVTGDIVKNNDVYGFDIGASLYAVYLLNTAGSFIDGNIIHDSSTTGFSTGINGFYISNSDGNTFGWNEVHNLSAPVGTSYGYYLLDSSQNTFHHNSAHGITSNFGTLGLYMNGNSDQNRILDNDIWNIQSNDETKGIEVHGSGGASDPDGNAIFDNTISFISSTSWSAGIYFNNARPATRNIIRENEIYNVSSSTDQSYGVRVYTSDCLLVDGNNIYNNDIGIFLHTNSVGELRNNLLHNNQYWSIWTGPVSRLNWGIDIPLPVMTINTGFIGDLNIHSGGSLTFDGVEFEHEGTIYTSGAAGFEYLNSPSTWTNYGDIYVDAPFYINDSSVEIHGNIYVNSSGLLVIDNSTVSLNGLADGQYGIEVRDGGQMELVNGSTLTAPNTAITQGEYQITGHVNAEGLPVAWGDFIVYENNSEIYIHDLIEGTWTMLSDGGGDSSQPDIYDNIVVWNDNGDIVYHDLYNGTSQTYARVLTQSKPSVFNGHIVYQMTNGGSEELWIYTIETGADDLLHSWPAVTCQNPDIHGRYIAWESDQSGNWDIWYYDMGDNGVFENFTGDDSTAVLQLTDDVNDQSNPVVGVYEIAWQDDRNGDLDIYYFNFEDNEEVRATDNPFNQHQPAIYSDTTQYIVFTDDRNGNNDIYALNLEDGSETQITTNGSAQASPSIFSTHIVWTDSRNGSTGPDIYMHELFETGPHRGYLFQINDTASFTSDNSFIHGVGYEKYMGDGMSPEPRDAGLYILSDDVVINDTEIAYGLIGLLYQDGNVTVTNSIFHDSLIGIVAADSPDISISNVDFNSLWQFGFVMQNSTGTMTDITATGNGLAVEAFGGGGMVRKGSTINLAGTNTFDGNGMFGLAVMDSTVTVSGDSFSSNMGAGILMFSTSGPSPQITADALMLNNNGQCGVYNMGGTLYLNNSQIDNNGWGGGYMDFGPCGVGFNGGALFLDSDIITNNNGYGIDINNAGNVTLEGNDITANGGGGVHIQYILGQGLIGNNTINNNGGYGINIESLNTVLWNGHYSDNVGDGIFTDAGFAGDWHIDIYGQLWNNDGVLNGDIFVYQSGRLSVSNTSLDFYNLHCDGVCEFDDSISTITSHNVWVDGTMYINSTTWEIGGIYDGQYAVQVNDTGALYIQDNGTGDSTITTTTESAWQDFGIETQTGFDQEQVDVGEGVMVWVDNSNGPWQLRVYNLGNDGIYGTADANEGGPYWVDDSSDSQQDSPAVYGRYIVWIDERDGPGMREVYLYDMGPDLQWGTGDEPATPVLRVTNDAFGQNNPDIWDDMIAWEDNRGGDWDIYGFGMGANRIYEAGGGDDLGQAFIAGWGGLDELNPAVSDRHIVFQSEAISGSNDIITYDEGPNQVFDNGGDDVGLLGVALIGGSEQINPSTYSNRVVWQDNRNGNWDVYVYDLGTFTEYRITDHWANEEFPIIGSNQIVWINDTIGRNLHVYQFSDTSWNQLTTSGSVKDQTPAIFPNAGFATNIVWVHDEGGASDLRLWDLGPNNIYQGGGDDDRGQFDVLYDSQASMAPSLWGDYVVYHDTRLGYDEIFIHETYGSGEWQVPTCGGGQNAAFNGRYIVREDNCWGPALGLYDLGHDREYNTPDDWNHFTVWWTGNSQYDPVISERYIVWIEDSGPRNIAYYDMGPDLVYGTGDDGGFNTVPFNGQNQEEPDVFGEYIVYRELNWWTPTSAHNIVIFHIPTATWSGLSDSSLYQFSPAIDGRYVVWQEWNPSTLNDNIYAYDMGPDEVYGTADDVGEMVVDAQASNQYSPDVYGNRVVWNDERAGWPHGLYSYDLDMGTGQFITSQVTYQTNPSIYGNTVSWEDYRYGWDANIVAASIQVTYDFVVYGDFYTDGASIRYVEGMLIDGAGIVNMNDTTITNSRGHGIDILNSNGVLLENMAIQNNLLDGLHISASDGLTIANSDISNNGEDGIDCWNSVGLTVTDSTLDANARDGLYLRACAGVAVDPTAITNSGQDGVWLEAGSAAFADVTVDGSARYGVMVQGSTLTSLNGFYQNSGGYDMLLWSASSAVSDNDYIETLYIWQDSLLDRTGGASINDDISGADYWIRNGTYISAGDIEVGSGSEFVLENATLEFNGTLDGEYAMDVRPGGMLISSLNTYGDGPSIIRARGLFNYLFRVWPGSTFNVANTTISGAGMAYANLSERGLYIATGLTTFRDNTLSENYYGVIFDGVAGIIENCTIYMNAATGIYGNESALTIAENRISLNGEDGILLAGESLNVASTNIFGNTIIANGESGILARADGSDGIFVTLINHANIISNNGASGIWLVALFGNVNGTIEQNVTGNQIGINVDSLRLESLTIRNTLIDQNSNDGVRISSAGWTVIELDSCVITSNGGNGLDASSITGDLEIIISDNSIDGNLGNGLLIAGKHDVYIDARSNFLDSNAISGLKVNSAQGHVTVDLADNLFENSGESAISLDSAAGNLFGTVASNTLTGNLNGISLAGGPGSTVAISNNLIVGQGSAGVGVMFSGAGGLVSGNNLQDLENGIHLSTSDASVTQNVVSSSSDCGIHLSYSNSLVDWNDLLNNKRGICALNSESTIADNLIDGGNDASRVGIYILDSSPVVNDNNIFNNGWGIVSTSSLASITSNLIQENLYGIVTENSTDTVSENMIDENSVCGLWIKNNSAPAVDGNIFNFNNVAVRISGNSSPSITGNTLTASTGAANLYIDSGHVSQLSGNSILNAAQDNVLISPDSGNTTAILTNNAISGAEGFGVSVDTSPGFNLSLILSKNTLVGNRLGNVRLTGSMGLFASLNNNLITGSTEGSGIIVDGELVYLEMDGNTVSNNAKDGIHVELAFSVGIENNDVWANNDCGIYLSSLNGGAVSANSLSSNRIGIHLEGSEFYLGSNTINNSGETDLVVATSTVSLLDAFEISHAKIGPDSEVYVEGWEIYLDGIEIIDSNSSLTIAHTLSVTVKDQWGLAIPEATVEIVNAHSAFASSGQTDGTGLYQAVLPSLIKNMAGVDYSMNPYTVSVTSGAYLTSLPVVMDCTREVSIILNNGPETAGLPDRILEMGTSASPAFDLDDYFDDDGGDPGLVYIFSGNTNILVAFNEITNEVGFAGVENWHGYEDITFRAIDAYGLSLEEVVRVTVNPGPTLQSVSIIPSMPFAGDSLSVNVSGASADTTGYRYQWYINGDAITGATLAGLAAGHFLKGDMVSVQVWPYNGVCYGETVTAPVVVIENSAPSITSVTLSPAVPVEGDTITAIPEGFTDPDMQDAKQAFRYIWRVDGDSVDGVNGPTLDTSYFRRGDHITVIVYPSDGEAEGDEVLASPVWVANTLPSLLDGSAIPKSGVEGESFTFNVRYFDIDGNIPTHIWVVIDNQAYNMTARSGEDGDATNGEIYQYTTEEMLKPGNYDYYFVASDEIGVNVTTVSHSLQVDDVDSGARDATIQELATPFLLFVIIILLGILLVMNLASKILDKNPDDPGDLASEPEDLEIEPESDEMMDFPVDDMDLVPEIETPDSDSLIDDADLEPELETTGPDSPIGDTDLEPEIGTTGPASPIDDPDPKPEGEGRYKA